MKLCVCLLIAILAVGVPTQALLGAKLALLGVLRNSIGGGGILEGYGNGGGGGYGGGYGGGGYAGGINYNRPVYTGLSSNYGWGQQSYGGGYSARYNGGNDADVKVIKVIVNHEQPQALYENYGRSSAASISTSAGGSWTSAAPAPVVQTYAAQPVQAVQVSAPSAVSAPAPVIQPPPRNIYVPAQPQYQYVQSAPQSIAQPPQSIQSQDSIRIVADGDPQHVPAQTYGAPGPAPAPAPSYVVPSGVNAGAWNSNSWSNANLGSGWYNGPRKNGGIWESIGC